MLGIPSIDVYFDGLIDFLRTATPGYQFGLINMAKSVGLLFAFCVAAYECWMMMLGRRVIDIMKLLRIIGLSMCITFSNQICNVLLFPGTSLESVSKHEAMYRNSQVAHLEKKVATLQNKYYEKVRALQDSIESAKRIQEIGADADWMEKIEYSISNLGSTIENFTKRAAIVTETKITEWVNLIIRFLGEAIFQITYYGLLLMQAAFLKLLAIFAPLMFAFSIAPPWSNAWSQWTSKYLSISLWGFVVHFCVYYADAILMYTLSKDIQAYTALIGKKSIGSWESIGTLGMQGIGSTCMYFVGMCIGALLLKSVPEVCSWLIPGGVSSSSASSAGSNTIGAASATGSAVGGIALAAGSAAAGAMGVTSAAAGGAVAGMKASNGSNPVSAVFQGTMGALSGAASGASAEMSTSAFSKNIKQSYQRGKDSVNNKNKE